MLMVKCFVRMENPTEQVPRSKFVFYDRLELASQGMKLSSDGHINNKITSETLTVQLETGVPFRGAREKTTNLLMTLIDLCTVEDDIVMDLTTSTGNFFSLHYFIYLLFQYFL